MAFDNTANPDRGISESQALNYGTIMGGMYPYAIAPASGGNADGHTWNGSVMPSYNDLTADKAVGYYMRPDHVLITPGLNCHEIYFMFSGSAEDALDHTGAGWVSFGSASYAHSGSNRMDISPMAWTGSGEATHGECEGQNAEGSGSVIFVYNSHGRIW